MRVALNMGERWQKAERRYQPAVRRGHASSCRRSNYVSAAAGSGLCVKFIPLANARVISNDGKMRLSRLRPLIGG